MKPTKPTIEPAIEPAINKRQLCTKCGYVQKNCLCSDIKAQTCQSKIIILQHPMESKHSKNSAKLVNLCIDNCQLIIGQKCEDFAQIQSQIIETVNETPNHQTYLIYPSDQAQAIEQLPANISSYKSTNPFTLIFIDASWRKAYKMWQQNPWLQQLPTLTFAHAPATRYQIRKHKKATSLSTIESVAYCLEQLESIETDALHKAFDAMIAMHNRYRP